MQQDLHHQQTQHGGGVLLSILPHGADPNHTTEPREISYVVDRLSRMRTGVLNHHMKDPQDMPIPIRMLMFVVIILMCKSHEVSMCPWI